MPRTIIGAKPKEGFIHPVRPWDGSSALCRLQASTLAAGGVLPLPRALLESRNRSYTSLKSSVRSSLRRYAPIFRFRTVRSGNILQPSGTSVMHPLQRRSRFRSRPMIFSPSNSIKSRGGHKATAIVRRVESFYLHRCADKRPGDLPCQDIKAYAPWQHSFCRSLVDLRIDLYVFYHLQRPPNGKIVMNFIWRALSISEPKSIT